MRSSKTQDLAERSCTNCGFGCFYSPCREGRNISTFDFHCKGLSTFPNVYVLRTHVLHPYTQNQLGYSSLGTSDRYATIHLTALRHALTESDSMLRTEHSQHRACQQACNDDRPRIDSQDRIPRRRTTRGHFPDIAASTHGCRAARHAAVITAWTASAADTRGAGRPPLSAGAGQQRPRGGDAVACGCDDGERAAVDERRRVDCRARRRGTVASDLTAASLVERAAGVEARRAAGDQGGGSGARCCRGWWRYSGRFDRRRQARWSDWRRRIRRAGCRGRRRRTTRRATFSVSRTAAAAKGRRTRAETRRAGEAAGGRGSNRHGSGDGQDDRWER